MKTCEFLTVIFLAIYAVYSAVWCTCRLIYLIKCCRVKDCHNRQCPFHAHCEKYAPVYTEEELERMRRLIDKLDETEAPSKSD